MLGSGIGLMGYADIDRRHTTIMAIITVCGGLLACLTTGGADELSTRQFRVTESMDPWN